MNPVDQARQLGRGNAVMGDMGGDDPRGQSEDMGLIPELIILPDQVVGKVRCAVCHGWRLCLLKSCVPGPGS